MSEDKNLRKAGLKVTLPRVRILEIFEQSSERHLSAEDIYNKIREAGDEVGLATVYRVLTQFESAGILMKQNFEDNYSVYELVSEDHHDHMVCIDSGAVIEFKNDLIEDEQEKIAKKYDMSLTHLALAFVNSQPFVVSNIIGATTMDQLRENIESVYVELSEDILEEVNQVHSSQPNPAP